MAAVTSVAPAPVADSTTRPRVIPGLDGLRALAIIAVVVFHLNPAWLPGGFVGVDMFFVVSGFLITTLLLREHERTGRVDLRAFWSRRARRLLPALLVCISASIWLAGLVERDLLVGIGRQTLGALTFSTNWVEIFAGTNYFNATSPQLFMNFWSLAVEEQFYLLWPLATIGILAAAPRLNTRVWLVTGLALASAGLMAVLYSPLMATRVHYGTDTHIMGLMLGAALAYAWAAPHRAWMDTRLWRRCRGPLLVGASVVLAACTVLLSQEHAFTFRGGLLLASVATTLLVAGVIDRPGPLRALLEHPVLSAIGARSYGIYLWHWPVILVVDQDVPTTPGTSEFLLTRGWIVLVTWAIADLSLRFVETPVRRYGFRGALGRVAPDLTALRRWRRAGSPVGRPRISVVSAAACLAIGGWLVGAGWWIVAAPETSSTQRLIEANAAAAMTGRDERAARVDASFTMPTGKEIDVFGDSMVVGAVPALKYYFPGIQIDAQSNRRWTDGLGRVIAAGDSTRRAVVLGLGTNAGTDEAALRATLDQLGPDRMVVVVNLHLARLSRVETDNATLKQVAADYPNVEVADWNAAVARTPGSLQPDGIHPSLPGSHVYAATIRQAFADLSERHTGTVVKLKPLPRP